MQPTFAQQPAQDRVPPLIAHLIHRLDIGGLENGLVNLINAMPVERYRHAILCMADYTDFSQRIQRPDVPLFALHKREGRDLAVHGRLWRRLRQLKPAILHTRNLGTLEGQATAALAGIHRRVHGEHGWDIGDPDGSSAKHRRLRRLFRPLVNQYIVLSRHQETYLRERVGVSAARVTRIVNGVDTERFHPAPDGRAPLPCPEFAPPGTFVIGSVLRMQRVKAPELLLAAFGELLRLWPEQRDRLRLVLIGDGPLLPELRAETQRAGLSDRVWLPGARADVPDLLRGMDLFVLPSLAEGICNGLLEAMASGLPVIATWVGGNPDLVADGLQGRLVAPGDSVVLREALADSLRDPRQLAEQGRMARERTVREFSLANMVARYLAVYDHVISRA